MTRLRACATIYAMPNIEDTKKFQQLLAMAQSDDVKAMSAVADAYFYGNGVEKNPQQCFAWTKKAADAGSPKAMHNLALAYKNGWGVEKDMSQFFAWTKKAADAGFPSAMFNLALAYKDGVDVEKDMSQFFSWMEKAADAGFPKAMHNISVAYRDGLGVEKDLHQFFEWTQKAADAGFPGAMVNLAIAYKDGLGVEKDMSQIFVWTKKAADADLPEAMFNLALAYKDGVGVEKDMSQYFAWTEKAADAGLPKAKFNLALAYKDGSGVEKDMQQYSEWMKKAAEAGLPEAMFHLAIAYKDGAGVKKDPKQFFHWAEAAYKEGVVEAAIMFPILRLWQNREIDEPTYDEIVKALFVLRRECQSILQKKHRVNEGQPLSHYTKFVALDSVLKGGESNHLRLYNVAYFNDPLEGAAFLSALGDQMCELIYGGKDGRSHEITMSDKIFSVYACAFSARDDYLPLWIAYGNNGDGYNITGTIPQHMKADEESGAMQEMHRSSPLVKDETATVKPKDAQIRVYKVQYGKAVKDTAQKLTRRLKELESILQGKGDKVIQAAKAVAEWILADLRYLYKHKAYRWEKEYRIIRVAKFGGEKIKEDDRTPPRFYLETLPFLFAESGGKVTVGPRVAEKDAAEIYIRQRLTKNGWNKTTDIVHSKMPYR